MRLFWWRDTGGVAVTESAELSLDRDAICHELRNALAGLQYERKQIARSLMAIQSHMSRIEEALK